ncbi:MAG: polysaccharide deacetylase family protein [Planctomycetaceae bacterium]
MISAFDGPGTASNIAESMPAPAWPNNRAEKVRDQLSHLKKWTLARAAVVFTRQFGPRLERAFGILMYHRVCPRFRGVPAPTWNVTPERFREQLSGLLARGYRPWPLKKVLALHQKREAIPRHVFVVTFDDGYANNLHYAWPVLKELNVPATIFLATAFIDTEEPFPFDDWSAKGSSHVCPESWKPLTFAQCDQLLDSGLIELGAHTHTHDDFRNRPQALAQDLSQCLDVLRCRFGISQATFAFPYGTRKHGFSGPLLSEAVRKTGAICSLTTESTLVRPGDDSFDWGRFTAERDDTAATLAAKLDGWYGLLPAIRGLAGRPVTAIMPTFFDAIHSSFCEHVTRPILS